MENHECQSCKRLTAVIDELSEMLANVQRSNRRIRFDIKSYKKLLVMDMEIAHDNEIGGVNTKVGLPKYYSEGLSEGQG